MRLSKRIRRWLAGWARFSPRVETEPVRQTGPVRGRVDHVVILDGTMSSLEPGRETNAGLTYRLLCDMGPSGQLSVCYESGIQWNSWKTSLDVIEGRGINRQIRRVYGFIASRYHPGDRIFLFGYSRGAYAVRSLAGMIDEVGLLKRQHATVRDIRQVYRFYRSENITGAQRDFIARHCHADTPIEMVGVWDTVKALGLHWPIIWRWTHRHHKFHNHELGRHIRNGFHALAMDETRRAFAPVLWRTTPGTAAHVRQVWFRGCHADIGGHLGGDEAARPLSNIPLVWMLEHAEACDLALPAGWRARFPCDAGAPSVGNWRGWGWLFWHRRARVIGMDPSESIHPTARGETARDDGAAIEPLPPHGSG